MKNITKYYSPNSGLAVISPLGMQKYTEKLNAFSQVFSSIKNSLLNNKHAIDSCWESGDIYYADYDSGYVKKIKYDNTEIASLKLINPVCVSVIQYWHRMSRVIPSVPQEDRGCWIADKGTTRIIKTDKYLNPIYAYSSVSNPKCIAADVDDGCIVVDDSSQKVIKLSSDAQILASINYGSFSPPITASTEYVKEIKPFKLVNDETSGSSTSSESSSSSSSSEDDGNRFWVLSDGRVYLLKYFDGIISQLGVIYPLNSLPTPPVEDGPYNVGSIDFDLNSRYLYVGVGNKNDSWIRKYLYTNEVLNNNIEAAYPYILKVVQGYGSDSLYIMSKGDNADDYVSSSSSTEIMISSSSSTGIMTSSSSSSISSSSSSSSSLSSSSSSTSSSSSGSTSSSSSNSSSSSRSISSSSSSSSSSTLIRSSSSTSSSSSESMGPLCVCSSYTCSHVAGPVSTQCANIASFNLTYGTHSSPTCDLYLRIDASGGAPIDARVYIYNQYPNAYPDISGSDFVAFGWNMAAPSTPITVNLSGPRHETGSIIFTNLPPSLGDYEWVKLACVP